MNLIYRTAIATVSLNFIVSRKSLALLALVVAIATPIGFLSNQYSTSTSQRIEEISIANIRSNADIQTHDLANSLSNRLADAVNTIEIIAGSPAILQDDQTRAEHLLNRAQQSTSELVDFYMWLDQDGKMKWISNINQTTLQQYANIDLSYRL